MNKARETNHGQTALTLVQQVTMHLETVRGIERKKSEGGYPPMEGDGAGIIGELIMARRRLKEVRASVKAALKEEMDSYHPLRLASDDG